MTEPPAPDIRFTPDEIGRINAGEMVQVAGTYCDICKQWVRDVEYYRDHGPLRCRVRTPLERGAHALGLHRVNQPSHCRFCWPVGKTRRVHISATGEWWDITRDEYGWSCKPVTARHPTSDTKGET